MCEHSSVFVNICGRDYPRAIRRELPFLYFRPRDMPRSHSVEEILMAVSGSLLLRSTNTGPVFRHSIIPRSPEPLLQELTHLLWI